MLIFDELKRRHVFKVAVAYVIVSWLIVQIASVFVPALRLPEWVLSLVALLLILGFPVAMFLAWAYALTPEGVRQTGATALPGSVRRLTTRRLNFTIIGLLTAALAFVVLDQYVLEERGRADPIVAGSGVASVAVLPFVSISGDPEQGYFSDGIAEELLNVLTRIPDLHVPSRTSSFSFKGTNASLETIAKELAVEHVLEGSVRREGDQVRITAQLIEVATNRSVWSETFNRELTSIFEIQDEIAARVADVLQIRLIRSAAEGSRTSSPDAHDAYLQGLTYIATQASADNANAITSFERAIDLDPQYAAAYAMLASAYNVARQFDYLPPEETVVNATVAVDRALELDPLLAQAYYERSQLTEDPGRQIADLQRAVELGLNDSNAHLSRSLLLVSLGRRAEARAALEKAVSLDPRSVQLNWMMGALRLNLGDRSGARGYYRRAIEIQPTSPVAYAGLGDVETARGRLDEGVRWYVAGLEQDPGQAHMTTWVGFLYLSLGDEARAATWLGRGAALLSVHGTAGDFISEFIPLVKHGNDYMRLMQVIRGVSPGLFDPFGSRMFRKAVLTTGKRTETRAYYEDMWPELFVEEPTIDANNFEVVPDVAWILHSEGEVVRATALLRDALAVFRSNDWAKMYPSDMSVSPLLEIEILALSGRDEDALSVMRSEIAKGWRFGWWQVDRDPVLASIRKRPKFADMMDEIKADMAMQLAGMPEYEPASASE
jgi:TolB-like protein/Flp pilus assembly protein TadD